GIYMNGANFVKVSEFQLFHQVEKGIQLRNTNHAVIDRNDVYHADGFGIYTQSSGTNVTVTKNTVTGVNHYGMYIRISNSLVEDNKISKVAMFDNLGLTGTGEDNFGGGIYITGENGGNT